MNVYNQPVVVVQSPIARGPQGLPGSVIHTGVAAPMDDFGRDGDYFLDYVGLKLYGPKTSGAWPPGVPLSAEFATLAEAIAGVEAGKIISPVTLQGAITNALASLTIPTQFTDLTDTPANYTGQSGKVVAVNGAENGLEFIAGGGGGATAFTALTDVPASYTGQAGKFAAVKGDETGLEFVAGGGGGSAYPENVTKIAAAGNTVLTSANQGYITALVSGVTIDLPNTAADGEIYKFIGGGQAYTVTAPTGFLTLGGTSFEVPAGGRPVTVMALNITPGPGLVWVGIAPNGASNYSATARFTIFEPVVYGGEIYISLVQNNVGNQPDISAQWFRLLPSAFVNGSAALISTDFSVSGGTPATDGAGSVSYKKSGEIVKLRVDAVFTPGTSNTGMVVDLTAARASVTNFPTFIPTSKWPAKVLVNSGAVICDGVYDVDTDAISITFPSALNLSAVSVDITI